MAWIDVILESRGIDFLLPLLAGLATRPVMGLPPV